MREIELTRGKVTIVDDIDYGHLVKFKWYINCGGYAARGLSVRLGERDTCSKNITYFMHTDILKRMGAYEEGKFCDHINRNKLDNRRKNLRSVTRQQNNCNRGLRINPTTSKYKGVSWDSEEGKWIVAIVYNGKQKYCGCFSNEIDAALAYDIAVLYYRGSEYSYLNFPVDVIKAANVKVNGVNYFRKENTSSRFYGVSFHKNLDKFQAYISYQKRTKFLGYFFDDKSAAIFRDNFIMENNLPCKRNFLKYKRLLSM